MRTPAPPDRLGSEDYAVAAAYRRTPGPWTDPTVLLLHGLGGDSGQLWSVFPSDAPLSMLGPDQRGHGGTRLVGGPEAFGFDGLARDQLSLLDTLGVGRVLVAGVSMGAGVAVSLALLAPARVSGLLLVRPAWLATARPAHLEPLRHLGELLGSGDVDHARSWLLESAEAARVRAASPAAFASLLRQLDDPRAVARSVRLRSVPESTPVSSESELARVHCPTTVVGAHADPLHPLAVAVDWVRSLSGSRLVTLPSRDTDLRGYEQGLRDAATAFVAGDQAISRGPGSAKGQDRRAAER